MRSNVMWLPNLMFSNLIGYGVNDGVNGVKIGVKIFEIYCIFKRRYIFDSDCSVYPE